MSNTTVSNTNTSDLIILGSGPGGYVAAIRAAQAGLKVKVIEKADIGGVCLNWGCIPTKSLLDSASVVNSIKSASKSGISIDNFTFSLSKMIEKSRKSIDQLSDGIKFLFKKYSIELIHGYGRLCGNGMISVQSSSGQKNSYTAKNIILATGARPKSMPSLPFDDNLIWSYKSAVRNSKLPQKLCIVGGGVIGVEFASIYNSLSVDVTIIERANGILPGLDKEVSDFMLKALESRGIKIILGANLLSSEKRQDEVIINYSKHGKEYKESYNNILVSVGVTSNIDDIGLENTKIKVENSVIKTYQNCSTDEKGVYAIGDITKGPWLAHKASVEGIRCVDHILGKNPSEVDFNLIPYCIYSFPEVACVGMTENEAIKKGYKVRIGRSTPNGNGKSIISNDTEGFVKTIFDSNTGEILGAHMIGKNVSEMIHSYAISMSAQITELDIFDAIFPHPTRSELLQESSMNAFSLGIHS